MKVQQFARSLWVLVLLMPGFALPAHGNAISVTNVSILNAEDGLADIQFDLSWSNGWNLTWSEDGGATVVTNRDAAWVFVKFRVGPGEWRQAWLAPTGHLATGETIIEVASNGGDTNVGAFIYLSNTTAGAVNCPGMRLKWAYTKNGMTGTSSVDISVHAIEMVYMPAAAFYLGSGGGEFAPFHTYPNVTTPYLVAGEAEIPVGTTNDYLYYAVQYYSGGDEFGANNWRGGDGLGPIPAGYPKGFAAMYGMKYEISQGQYADFLNYAGGYAGTYYPGANGAHRHTLSLTGGVYVASAPDRACNYLSWADLAAYLDWAALRPMTELEYEKACRGPLSPVANEYAWGSISIQQLTGFVGSDGSGEETASPPTANANYDVLYTVSGPARAGIYATATSTRYAAGAGYYGAMELGGNVNEMVIGVNHPDGRAFTAQHGDGLLMSRPSTWPGSSSIGVMTRGGSFESGSPVLRTSNRSGVFRDYTYLDSRRRYAGGRGVRSVP